MKAPDTELGGAADTAVAARWPEIGQPAEQNTRPDLAPLVLGAAPMPAGPRGFLNGLPFQAKKC